MDRYYIQGVMYALRKFVLNIFYKYLEQLEETNQDEYTKAKEVVENFEKWLYQTTKIY